MRIGGIVAPLVVCALAVPAVHAAQAAPRSGVAHDELVALHEPGGARGDEFGRAVAVAANGSAVLVGAYDADGGRGAAYLYVATRLGWPKAPTATFASPSGPGAHFGFAVALSPDGTTAYVSADQAAVGRRGDAGAVYAYAATRGTWPTVPSRTIDDPGSGTGDDFGVSLAVASDGSALVVGAPGHAVAGTAGAGAAYVFVASKGALPATPTATLLDPSKGRSLFGYGVAVADDATGRGVAVVGAYASAVGGAASVGAAYVFAASGPSTWALAPGGRLADPGRVGGDAFGTTVATDAAGNLAMVAAPGERARGTIGAGAVYTFARVAGAWVRKQTLTVPTSGDVGFGAPAIAASGATAIAGAPGQHVDGHAGAGVAFVFVGPGTTLTRAATIGDPTGGSASGPDDFGTTAAESADGDTAVIGAPATTGAGGLFGPGAAYVYDVAPPPVVRKVAPQRGSHLGGTTVTVTGTGLGGATAVRFGTEPAASYVVAATGTRLTAVTPPHAAGSVRVSVTTPGGETAPRAATFTFT